MQAQNLYDRIIDILKEFAKPPRAVDLAKRINEDEPTIEAALDRLEQEGRVAATRKGRYLLPESVGLTGGTFLGNRNGYGFFRPAGGGPDLFIGPEDMIDALHGDTVLVRAKRKQGLRPAGTVEKIVYRKNEEIIGTFQRDDNGCHIVPDDHRIQGTFLIKEKYGKGAMDAQTGDKVVYSVMEWPDGRGAFRGRITEIIGSSDDAGVEIDAVLRRKDICESFTRKAKAEADALSNRFTNGDFKRIDLEDLLGREDFRDQVCFTIDGSDAKDFDDAIAVEQLDDGNVRLFVHIADVSHYVREGSGFDREAAARGTSVYLTDRVIPMLPEILSNELCSLKPNEDRLCLSCIMDVNVKNGALIDYRIVKSVIRSKARLYYHEVNALLERQDPAAWVKLRDQLPSLFLMDELHTTLARRRAKLGSIDFDLPEAEIELDENGVPVRVDVAERGVSNRMIEEFMLYANETVAIHATSLGIPFLYRVHERPQDEKVIEYGHFASILGYSLKPGKLRLSPLDLRQFLESIAGKPEERLLSKLLLRAMQKARYSTQNLGHYGLAMKNYCHFTSPIRRYPDLFIHRMLKYHLSGALDEDAIARLSVAAEEAAERSSARERNATETEREVEQLMMARYMATRIGEEFDGVIDGVSDFGIFVELPNTISGMTPISSLPKHFFYEESRYAVVGPGGAQYRIGDGVRVRLVAANPETRRIDFIFVTDGNQ